MVSKSTKQRRRRNVAVRNIISRFFIERYYIPPYNSTSSCPYRYRIVERDEFGGSVVRIQYIGEMHKAIRWLSYIMATQWELYYTRMKS